MIPSRRFFLRGAAALPLAATAVGSAVVASMAPASALEAGATFVPIAPKHDWKWWLSHDGGDTYIESFATREKAIAEAEVRAVEDGHGVLVSECLQEDFNLTIDGERIIEMLSDRNEDRQNEDGDFLIKTTTAQVKDLGAMLTATVATWVAKHGIDTTAWIFASVRNEHHVPAPAAPADPLPSHIRVFA